MPTADRRLDVKALRKHLSQVYKFANRKSQIDRPKSSDDKFHDDFMRRWNAIPEETRRKIAERDVWLAAIDRRDARERRRQALQEQAKRFLLKLIHPAAKTWTALVAIFREVGRRRTEAERARRMSEPQLEQDVVEFLRRLPVCDAPVAADEVVVNVNGVIARLKDEGRSLSDTVRHDVYDRISWDGQLRPGWPAVDILLKLTKYDNGGTSVSDYLHVRRLAADNFALSTWQKHLEWN